MPSYFYKDSYNTTIRWTLTKDGATLDLSSTTLTVKIKKPSGVQASYTVSNNELSVYDEANGIIEFGSVDDTLWNEEGIYKIQAWVDNLPADPIYVEIRGIVGD